MTTNQHQLDSIRIHEPAAILEDVLYTPALANLGKIPRDWVSPMHFHGDRRVLRVGLDLANVKKQTLMDNVTSELHIHSETKSIQVLPVLLEVTENTMNTQQDLVLMMSSMLTELNHTFDFLTAKTLEARAVKDSKKITWTCAPAFVNDINTRLLKLPRQAEKIVIIGNHIEAHVSSIASAKEYKNWIDELSLCLGRNNATLRICEYVKDNVYIIVKPLVQEYSGLIPTVKDWGVEARKNEYWTHFIMSISDFHVNKPEALMRYETDGLDVDSLNKVDCGKA